MFHVEHFVVEGAVRPDRKEALRQDVLCPKRPPSSEALQIVPRGTIFACHLPLPSLWLVLGPDATRQARIKAVKWSGIGGIGRQI